MPKELCQDFKKNVTLKTFLKSFVRFKDFMQFIYYQNITIFFKFKQV